MMESRGRLSEAALKILAALRAQSRAARHNSHYFSNQSQTEACYGNQRETWTESSWRENQDESAERDACQAWSVPQSSPRSASYQTSNQRHSTPNSTSYQRLQTSDCSPSPVGPLHPPSHWDTSFQRQTPQTEGHYQTSQTHSHRRHPEPPARQSIQALSFTQHEASETEAPIYIRDTNTLSLQIPEQLSGHQATPWGNSTDEIRPCFILDLSPEDDRCDELLFPTTERCRTHKVGPVLTCQAVTSCPQISVDTDKNISGVEKGTESRSIPTNVLEDAVDSVSQSKQKPQLFTPTEKATKRGEEGRVYQKSTYKTEIHSSHSVTRQSACWDTHALETIKLGEEEVVDSENMETVRRQMLDISHQLLIGTNFLSASEIDSGKSHSDVAVQMCDDMMSPCQLEHPEVSGQTLRETGMTRRPSLGHLGSAREFPADKLERNTGGDREVGIEAGRENNDQMEATLCHDVGGRRHERDNREFSELLGKQLGASRKCRDKTPTTAVLGEDERIPTEVPGQGKRPTPLLSQECWARLSGFGAPVLVGDPPPLDNRETASGCSRGNSSRITVATASSCVSVQNTTLQGSNATRPEAELKKSTVPHQFPLIPPVPSNRKCELLQLQNGNPPPKISRAKFHRKWEQLRSSRKRTMEGGVSERKIIMPQNVVPGYPASTQGPQTEASTFRTTKQVLGLRAGPHAPRQTRQRQTNSGKRVNESTRNASGKNKHKKAKLGPHEATNQPRTFNKGANPSQHQNPSKTACLTTTLASDLRVKHSGELDPSEKMQMLERVGRSKVLVLTLVYQDGTTQLDPQQKLAPPVCGLLVLMKDDPRSSIPSDSLGPDDALLYLNLECTPSLGQQHMLFTRDTLLQVLTTTQLVVCYKAKDLLCTALTFYRQQINWKQVAGCHIHDPQVSGWLLDPADPSASYQDLLHKHFKTPRVIAAQGTMRVNQVISSLYSLNRLNTELCSKLKSQGLWALYADMEMNMIPVLAVMESHHIHVDKEVLKTTSDLLGERMKQLEQEAHVAAGEAFLVTSNDQLRSVLFEKLRLHERCENKKLPKTVNKQQHSTSEAALLQLRSLHPLPKIILEYRQVHKTKSTFVDGILSCMTNKDYISSTWCQTSVVTGRISAKHPNFQALPRQPLQITKKQYVQGKEEELLTVHPRSVFIAQDGWTFLAADFCQVELRLLAHLSSDPELLRIFTNPRADVFTMLASQWTPLGSVALEINGVALLKHFSKGVSEDVVTSEDREHAKRIVYSVVYGAGRERLSGILGVSVEQARHFQDTFLQTYREVQAFIQRTIQQCHKRGHVLSIMGRRRTLPNINSSDWGSRMQAERQAVNFVVQGSAADLCKMAMIRIFKLVSSSSSLSARLKAQLHDELLYEVEDSQVEEFAALVKTTMESLQHMDHLSVHLKVPLKVAVYSGKSWGSMSELNIPPTSSSCSFASPP